jgi:hypothetical protein
MFLIYFKLLDVHSTDLTTDHYLSCHNHTVWEQKAQETEISFRVRSNKLVQGTIKVIKQNG